MVLREYDLTMEWVLMVTGHRRLLEDRRVLSWAIELRNPYVDALSHLQLRALRGIRDPRTSKGDRALAERVFQLSVNGVAAGLQSTGESAGQGSPSSRTLRPRPGAGAVGARSRSAPRSLG